MLIHFETKLKIPTIDSNIFLSINNIYYTLTFKMMTFRSLGITLQKPTTNDRRLPDRNQKSKIQKKYSTQFYKI